MGFINLRRQLMFVNEKYSLRTTVDGKALLIHLLDPEVYDEDKKYLLNICNRNAQILEQYFFDDLNELDDLEILARAAEKDRFSYESCFKEEDKVLGFLN